MSIKKKIIDYIIYYLYDAHSIDLEYRRKLVGNIFVGNIFVGNIFVEIYSQYSFFYSRYISDDPYHFFFVVEKLKHVLVHEII